MTTNGVLAGYPTEDALPRGVGRSPAAGRLAERLRATRLLTVDDPVRTVSAARYRELVRRLGASVDLIVAGEPSPMLTGLSPSHRGLLLAQAGCDAIIGVNCRDRNRVAIEGEIAAIAAIGLPGLLAVTGDPPAETSVARPVFDVDSAVVAALGAESGLFVACAVDPRYALRTRELERLRSKLAAGAECVFVNLGTPEDVRSMLNDLERLGSPPAIVCLPVAGTPESAERLAALGAMPVDGSGGDTGVAAAVWSTAVELLPHPRVRGLHLCPVPARGSDGAAEIDLVAMVVERIAPLLDGRRDA